MSRLHGARYRINPDRIEAGTFLIAGAITGGDLIVANCNPAHLGAVIAKVREAGARVDILGRMQYASARMVGCAPPISQQKSTPVFPPICRRNTWRWRHRQRA